VYPPGHPFPAVAVQDDADRPITRLLQEWQDGNAQALERLIPLVYDELRALASRHLAGERSHHTLQTTALVHEAYVKLAGQHSIGWKNRAHFFAIAAQLMRRILVDHARHAGRVKRGGGRPNLPLDVEPPAAPAAVDLEDAHALDQALTRLEALDAQQGRVVELRYFGGLTVEETAEVMGLSTATIKREWAVARAWLHRELAGEAP
jgi:RNA polymerase sigma factor (TIGR02999 family)